jgi:hypothetical protein
MCLGSEIDVDAFFFLGGGGREVSGPRIEVLDLIAGLFGNRNINKDKLSSLIVVGHMTLTRTRA